MKAPLGLSLRVSFFLAGVLLVFYVLHFNPQAPGIKWDFEEFYATANLLRHGDATPLYNNLYPAAHALVFLPLTLLPLKAAYGLWTAINIAFLFVSVRLLQRELRLDGGDWPLFAALLLPGVWGALLHGQFSLMILLLYTCAFVQLRRDHEFAAGILVGLAAIKFHLILGFVAIMLLRRAWKFVAGAAVSGGAIAIVSAAMVGIHRILAYPSRLHAVANDPQLSRLWMMVNLRSLFFAIIGHEPSIWLVAVASAALLVYVAYSWKNLEVGFPCAVLASTIAAYHAYPQELTLFIPFLALFATRIRLDETTAIATMLAAALVACGMAVWLLYPLYPLIALGLLVLVLSRRAWRPSIEAVSADIAPISQ